MITRLTFALICLQMTAFAFGQTEKQKQIMYEYINRDAGVNSTIIAKIKPIANKEELFLKAQVLPVYKAQYDEANSRMNFEINKDDFLLFYVGRLYVFTESNSFRLFENSPLITTISEFNSKKLKFKIIYFEDKFSLYGTDLNPLVYDESSACIIDKGLKYKNGIDYLNSVYGSIEKYKEKREINQLRNKISLADYMASIKTNYHAFEYNCPKDSAIVLNAFMNQIKDACMSFSKTQEKKLLEKIKIKISPFDYLQKTVYKNSKQTAELLQKSKEEDQEYRGKIIKLSGSYDFYLYDVNITNELIEVLSNDQFIAYKNYIDIYYPLVETNDVFKSARYQVAIEALAKAKNIKSKSYNEFQKFSEKILLDCGCPFDETIKRKIIIN